MANKKLFEDLVLTSTPNTTDRFALGKSGSAYKNITAADLKTWIIAGVPSPPAPEFLTKVVEIGGFDMDKSSDASKDVNLGVARSRIRDCHVLIRSNDGGLYPLPMPAGNKEIKSYWWIRQESTYASNARVSIRSINNVNPSFFKQSAFNGTSTNRGYIFVTYTA